jgi:hypothetical protein
MRYDSRAVYAHYLYLDTPDFDPSEGRLARVSPEGVIARGCATPTHAPLDHLLILRRDGSRLELVDELALDSGMAIEWNGVTSITSNLNLIAPAETLERE